MVGPNLAAAWFPAYTARRLRCVNRIALANVWSEITIHGQ